MGDYERKCKSNSDTFYCTNCRCSCVPIGGRSLSGKPFAGTDSAPDAKEERRTEGRSAGRRIPGIRSFTAVVLNGIRKAALNLQNLMPSSSGLVVASAGGRANCWEERKKRGTPTCLTKSNKAIYSGSRSSWSDRSHHSNRC